MKSAPVFLPSRIVRPTVVAVTMALLAAALSVVAVPAANAAAPCTAPIVSKVACENTQPGNPASEWQVAGAGSSTIQGYATSMSINIGDTVKFKVKTPSTSYHIDVYRLGYYQGLGARKVAANVLPGVTLPQTQPACATFSATGLIDCGNWAVSASWVVPASAVSGVYLARLVRNDATGVSVIPFVVRDDAAHSDVMFQTSDTTWQAYNSYGGNSLYACTVSCPPGSPLAYKAAFKVSYNRPFSTAGDAQGQNWLMYAEYPMIRFMEANGYDVSYMSGLDIATKGPLLLNHKSFMSVGHDEYWSADQRANVEAARDAGVHLAFFSGNEAFWKTRWEPSSDGTSTPGRTLVSYKDTHFNAPTDPVAWTGTWRDPRYGTATGGGNPENALTGQFFLVNSGTTDITVPASFSKLRLWRNTTIAGLSAGSTATLGAGLGTLGYEWDSDSDNGFRPAGSFKLSQTISTTAEVFTDYGSTTKNPGTATHNLTTYKTASGALVFGAGTVQWSWGLDGYTTGKAVDKNMQQATINLFADMGTQPVTIIAGLTPAVASTDTTAPTSSITSPAGGTTIADGTVVTISGTAADTGGVVAGVEISTDGGKTWRPATGTTNWTFSWNAHGSPTSVIRSRAVDDSGNLESPAQGSVTNISCPCSLVGVNVAPAAVDSGDGSGVEVGAKFYSDVAGTISAVRFYKAAKNTGAHVGNVWNMSGQRLATATFTGESSTGWQTVSLSPALSVTANTMYVVSYYAPSGHYSQDEGFFYNHPSPPPAGNGSTDSAPLHFTRSLPGAPNGFFRYSTSSTFPNQIYDAEYYWVDAVFSPSAPAVPAVSSVSPASGATGVAVSVKPAATFNQSVTGSSVVFTVKDGSGTAVAGTVGYDSVSNTATFTPGSALGYSTSYTATVSGATNSTGQTMTAYSWTFTTAAAPAAPAVSSVSPASGATGVDVGVKPAATFNQAVTASSVSFSLQDSGGNAVSGAVSYDSASNTATFSPGGALAYGTTYTASVSGATNSTGQTMTAPYSWTFTTAAAPVAPAVSSVSPASGATAVDVGVKPAATFNQAVTASSVVFTLKDSANSSVSGTVSYDSTSKTAAFTPGSSLAYSMTYTATVSGAMNATGQTMASPYSWTFTTAASPAAPVVSSVSPASGATGVDVGVKPAATFNQAVIASSVSFSLKDSGGNAVSGAVSYDSASNTATFSPGGALAYGTTYTASVSGATNSTGQTMTAYSWTFTTAAAAAGCPCSVFSAKSVPSTVTANDANAVELGMKFRSDVAGTVSGVRFYKGSSNTGTHTGHLWSASGTLLASVTFAGETASGWQQASFSTPVAIAANTTYVVSYQAPNGFYSANGGYFSSAADAPPLHGLASGVDGSNGVYNYGATAFPTNSYNNTNYWVDVIFNR